MEGLGFESRRVMTDLLFNLVTWWGGGWVVVFSLHKVQSWAELG